jgi:hypothetical protein
VGHSTATPDQFFAITYATENLRKFCSGAMARLAGRADGVSLVNIAQTFGGGKTHALGTLYYLCALGSKLQTQLHAVSEILAASKLLAPPAARIAAVSFDKVDWKAGGLVKSPDGEARQFRMPWNLIAWQLLGKRGIEILRRDENEPDYYEPPAQSLWMELLVEVEKEGIGALILLDEFLMWAHGAASPDPDRARQDKGPVWYDRLSWDNAVAESFFHTLKIELVYVENFDTHEQAQTAVFEYIEVFYNRQRCHSANGYLAPLVYEQTLKTNEIFCPEKC